jgi:hypothetical protein
VSRAPLRRTHSSSPHWPSPTHTTHTRHTHDTHSHARTHARTPHNTLRATTTCMLEKIKTGTSSTGTKSAPCCGTVLSLASASRVEQSHSCAVRCGARRLGVFDGHSGSAAADFLCRRLLPNIDTYVLTSHRPFAPRTPHKTLA